MVYYMIFSSFVIKSTAQTTGYDGRGYAVMASFVGSEDGKEHEYMLWTLKGRNLIYNLLKYEIGIIPESATIYKEKTKKKTKKKGGNK